MKEASRKFQLVAGTKRLMKFPRRTNYHFQFPEHSDSKTSLRAALPNLTPRNDKDIGVFLGAAGFLAFADRFAPFSNSSPSAPNLLPLAAALRMVNGIHRGPADGRSYAKPA